MFCKQILLFIGFSQTTLFRLSLLWHFRCWQLQYSNSSSDGSFYPVFRDLVTWCSPLTNSCHVYPWKSALIEIEIEFFETSKAKPVWVPKYHLRCDEMHPRNVQKSTYGIYWFRQFVDLSIRNLPHIQSRLNPKNKNS